MFMLLGAAIGFFYGWKGLAWLMAAIVVFIVIHWELEQQRDASFWRSVEARRNEPPRKNGGIRF